MQTLTHSIDPAELLEHSDWMRSLARRLVLDADTADDVVQEAWAAALNRPPRQGVPLAAWLAGVVQNLARSTRRAGGRRAARERDSARSEAIASTDELTERAELQGLLAEHVQQLPEKYREVVLLRYFEDLKPAAIARHLDVSVNTVNTRHARAMERLRTDLDRHFGGDRREWCLALIPLAALDRGAVGLAAQVKSSAVGAWALAHPVQAAAAAVLLVIAGGVGAQAVLSDPAPLQTAVAATDAGAGASRAGVASVDGGSTAANASDDQTGGRRAAPMSSTVVRGRVVDRTGRPVADVDVWSHPPESAETGATLGFEQLPGGFPIEALPVEARPPELDGTTPTRSSRHAATTGEDGSFEFALAVGELRPDLSVSTDTVIGLRERTPSADLDAVELVVAPLATTSLQVVLLDRETGERVPRFDVRWATLFEGDRRADREPWEQSTPARLPSIFGDRVWWADPPEETLDDRFESDVVFAEGFPLRVTARILSGPFATRSVETTVRPIAGEPLVAALSIDLYESQPGDPLHGRVVDAATGEPIAGARVGAAGTRAGREAAAVEREVQTRADGSFRTAVDGVDGTALVFASHPHFEPAPPVWFGGSGTVTLELVRRASLNVRVIDGAGLPIARAPLLVRATQERGGAMSFAPRESPYYEHLRADSAGALTIPHLRAGGYLVHVLGEAGQPDEMALARTAVELAPSEQRDLVLQVGGDDGPVVTGTVTGLGETPCPVIPYFVSYAADGTWQASEPEGLQYRAEGLRPGTYLVLLGPASDDYADEVPFALLPGVEITDAREQSLDFAYPEGSVTGQLVGLDSPDQVSVTLTPIVPPGLAADLLADKGSSLARIDVESDGRFEVPYVAPGRYRLAVHVGRSGPLAERDVTIEGSGSLALGTWDVAGE